MDTGLLVLFIIFMAFPSYHVGKKFFYQKVKKLPCNTETGSLLAEPKVVKLSFGRVCDGLISVPSSPGKQFQVSSPVLSKKRAGDLIPVIYYGADYKDFAILKDKKTMIDFPYSWGYVLCYL